MDNESQTLLLTPDEVKVVLKLREEKEDRNAKEKFRVKAIETAAAFEKWSADSGDGLTFSTFVNSFDYQDNDVNLMFRAIQRIQAAAYPQ